MRLIIVAQTNAEPAWCIIKKMNTAAASDFDAFTIVSSKLGGDTLAPPAENLAALCKEHGVSPALQRALEELLALDKKSCLLSHMGQLLDWDRDTCMPHGAIAARAEQSSLIQSMAHALHTDPRVAEMLHTLSVNEENHAGSASLPAAARAFLRKKYRQWKKNVSVPPELVASMAKEAALGFGAWVDAKKNSDFAAFKPHLSKLLDLAKNYADCIGYETCAYDALLDEYEPRCTVSYLDPLFASLQTSLTPLYQARCEDAAPSALPSLDAAQQEAFCRLLAKGLGYTDLHGRIDATAHPFCATVGQRDVRITTRYIEAHPLSAIFSVLHEIGHALYELNIARVYDYTLCSEGASFGVHESQSRFLENVIGRSRAFWQYWYPQLQKTCAPFSRVSFDAFMRCALHVQKNPLRVESDEVGYNLHVILRFEMEKILFADAKAVHDAPRIWNDLSERILGLRPKNDAEGILQDVHWSHGAFGYFPSYALGNIYAARLSEEMDEELAASHGGYEAELAAGNIGGVTAWLTKRVHRYGAAALPEEIFPAGDAAPLLRYLQNRYGEPARAA